MMCKGSIDFSLGGWPHSLRWSCLEQDGRASRSSLNLIINGSDILHMFHRELRFSSVDNENTPRGKEIIIVCILLDCGCSSKKSRLGIIERIRADESS